VSQYPSITQFGIAGCTAASATCSISSLQGVSISSGGGPNVQAMRGHGWNIGTDYKPSFLPGARVSATFWDVAFLGGITNPTLQTRLNNQSLNYSVSFYPGCASAAQTAALQTNAVISTVLPSCIQYSVLSANTNYTSFWAQGLDANVGYTMDTDIGTFSTDENLTLATKFDQGFAYHSAPAPDQIFSSLNSEGSNTTFPNVALQMRGHLGWADDGLVADVYVNYTGAYRNIASPVNPIVLTSSGVYSGVGGDHVNANLTMDLHFGYTFTSDVLVSSENRISFTIKNALGSAPPYFNSSTGYDPYVANIVGRTYTISLSEKF
jgi:iron complex outermembrane receptor protein